MGLNNVHLSRRDFFKTVGLGLAGSATAITSTPNTAKADGDGRLQDQLDLNDKQQREREARHNLEGFLPAAVLGIIAIAALVLASVGFRASSKDASKNTKSSQDEKGLPQQLQPNQNFLGEKIEAKPIDVDAALKALKEFRDNQNLPSGEQAEIKKVLPEFISILERIKQLNDKENLAIGDEQLLRKTYFELEDALNKLNDILKIGPDLEGNKIAPGNWEELSTGIKVLKN